MVRNTAYHIIAHASKFVPPGSRHVASTASMSLPNVAFLTPQRNLVLLMLNRTDRAQTFHVEARGRVFPVTLDRGCVATVVVPVH